jgi:hypothetical protein
LFHFFFSVTTTQTIYLIQAIKSKKRVKSSYNLQMTSLQQQQRHGGVYVVSATQVLENAKCYPKGTKSFRFEKTWSRRVIASDHDSTIQLSLEYQSFYMTFIPDNHDKINVEHDQRSLEDLKTSFPAVATDKLTKLWEHSTSWVHCFSILSAIASENKAVVITADQFDIMSHEWPLLPRDGLFIDDFAGMSLEERDGWTLCTQLDLEDGDTRTSTSSSEDWELVDDLEAVSENYPETNENENKPSPPVASGTDTHTAPGRISYRDMVLRNLAAASAEATKEASRGRRAADNGKVWAPVFVLDDPMPSGTNKRGRSCAYSPRHSV